MAEHPALVALSKRETPVRQWLPKKIRDTTRVPPMIAHAMAKCGRGEWPWPLTLWGGPGIGKSCAGLLMSDWVEWSYFWTLKEMCEEYRKALMGELFTESAYCAVKMNWADMDQMLGSSSLVVVDELGEGRASEHVLTVLRSVLDAREGKATMFLSNHSPRKLERLYGAPIMSRIQAGTVIECKLPDRRKQ